VGILDIFEAILQPPQPSSRSTRRPSSDRSQSSGVRLPSLEPLPKPGSGGIGDVMHSVVQIVAMREGFMGGMTSAWTGSGTIVHPQGIILTNCHVANPRAMGMSSPPADRLGISITEESDRAPALSYFAQVVAYNADLDLAVIRITHDVKGRSIKRLNLPCVTLGDSDDLDLGDRISIFGYPGIGETVTFTAGNVAGFSKEDSVRSPRGWIKTDATIAGGNSGGTAVNQHGRLVGVPTQAAAGTGITPVDARPVLDTNKDGCIDQRDTPMAIGGFINGLRPVNLAIPLLEKAGMKIARDRSSHDDIPEEKPQPIRGFDFDRIRERPSFSKLPRCQKGQFKCPRRHI
jgi:S1-C subfamily serine protease